MGNDFPIKDALKDIFIKELEMDRAEFEEKTVKTIANAGEWLTENAEFLANNIVGGCKNWTIILSAGEDGMFPTVELGVNRYLAYSTGYGLPFENNWRIDSVFKSVD